MYSDYFSLSCGVRQGGVLSPCSFAIFIDSIMDRVRDSGLGCYLRMTCFSIYSCTQTIFYCWLLLFTHCSFCEDELSRLDMRLNSNKSVCIRIGPRFKADCCIL